MTVSKDKTCAIASVFVTDRTVAKVLPMVSFKGLNPAFVYDVSTRKQDNYDEEISFSAGGDFLMNNGIQLTGIFDDKEALSNSGCVFSRMYIFKKAK